MTSGHVATFDKRQTRTYHEIEPNARASGESTETRDRRAIDSKHPPYHARSTEMPTASAVGSTANYLPPSGTTRMFLSSTPSSRMLATIGALSFIVTQAK